ncbi:hypothetical protein HYY74_06050 [Candidatus Woesearchaeota archaeon]|nr:hypothetical protein [Candidatus Woesearchaeota archaeon]
MSINLIVEDGKVKLSSVPEGYYTAFVGKTPGGEHIVMFRAIGQHLDYRDNAKVFAGSGVLEEASVDSVLFPPGGEGAFVDYELPHSLDTLVIPGPFGFRSTDGTIKEQPYLIRDQPPEGMTIAGAEVAQRVDHETRQGLYTRSEIQLETLFRA